MRTCLYKHARRDACELVNRHMCGIGQCLRLPPPPPPPKKERRRRRRESPPPTSLANHPLRTRAASTFTRLHRTDSNPTALPAVSSAQVLMPASSTHSHHHGVDEGVPMLPMNGDAEHSDAGHGHVHYDVRSLTVRLLPKPFCSAALRLVGHWRRTMLHTANNARAMGNESKGCVAGLSGARLQRPDATDLD